MSLYFLLLFFDWLGDHVFRDKCYKNKSGEESGFFFVIRAFLY